jgi:hypothetical protein
MQWLNQKCATKAACMCALLLFCALGVGSGAAHAQDEAEPTKVTMCDLYQDPAKYQGKMVAVHARVAGNDLWIDDLTQQLCPQWTEVIVVFPDRIKPRPDFGLVRDDSLSSFVESVHKGKAVEATFYGRFYAVFTWRDHKRQFVGSVGEKGFGVKHNYGAEIVLRSVSDVVAWSMPRR